jgi:hypothetical protein
MPAVAKLVHYEGRDYPSQALCDLLGVSYAVLQRWLAQGGVTPGKVALYQQERAQRRIARVQARSMGLSANALYQRTMRGETLLEACSRRALSRAEVCARMRAAKERAA